MNNMRLHSACGDFTLRRFPSRHPKSLRAWDAADEYLIEYAAEQLVDAGRQRLLLINDMFGALSVALHAWDITVINDAFVSSQAIALNYSLNQLDQTPMRVHCNVDELVSEYRPDAVLIKLPKDLDYFKAQLAAVATRLEPGTPVIAAGMIKHMGHSYSQALQRYIGPSTASLAKKKARLLISHYQSKEATPSPQQSRYHCDLNGLNMINFPNTFSYGQLDAGAQWFVTTMLATPPAISAAKIIDLGCGDGILGLTAAGLFPSAGIAFIDNSAAALQSARASAAENFSDTSRFQFNHADCLSDYRGGKADWILCNPPFHQEFTISTHVAEQMFRQARKHLKADGRLWVICNRHLRYRSVLKQLFGVVEQLAGNDKFLIFEAKFH